MDEAFAELGQQCERLTDSLKGLSEAAQALEDAWKSYNTRLGEDQ